MEQSNGQTPRVRPKQFNYHTTVSWSGERKGLLGSSGKETLTISSPPEFKGSPGFWTPEDMFVGAIETCQLLTFLALAKRSNLTVLSYRSAASGVLEFLEGSYRFTRVTITPEIEVAGPVEEIEVLNLVSQAHRQCLVSNSISAAVIVDPKITIEDPVRADIPD